MKIAILGGGNVGTLTAAELSLKNNVRIYTSNTTGNKNINVYNKNEELLYTSGTIKFSNDLKEVIEDAEVIISTFPSNIFPKFVKNINSYIKENAYLIFMPGTGGKEYITKKYISKNINIVGLQRVYSIARLKEKGKSVYMLGKKERLYASAIPRNKTKDACELLQKLFNIPTYQLNNYLEVTFTPSNPILHTSRLYSMFKSMEKYKNEILFYEDWDYESAEILFKCDEELQKLCNKLDEIDLTGVVSLKKYYESSDEESFVNKIKSIESFKGISAPMIEKNGIFLPDYNSRYFTEDFPFGLFIIKGFSEICQVDTPIIDDVLRWFQTIKEKEYLIGNKLTGKDIKELGIPQNYGIRTIQDIYNFYM